MPLPKDKGWSWMVLIGAITQMTLTGGLNKSAGILFVAFQERFDSSSATTSLLSTVLYLTYSIAALFVMTFGIKLATCRTLVFLGSLVHCIGYIITSRAHDVRVLLVSYGIFIGIGNALTQSTSLTMVGFYFDKRRGFANSLTTAGSSFGGLMFAQVITSLLDEYGYQGLLVIAAVSLHGSVSAALYRPTKFYETSNRSEPEEKPLAKIVHNQNDLISDIDLSIHAINEQGIQEQPNEFDSREHESIKDRHSSPDIPCLNADLGASILKIHRTMSESSINDRSSSRISKRSNVFKTLANLFDISVFSIPVFIAFEVSAILLCPATMLSPVFVAPHAKELLNDTKKVPILITILSSLDLISRIVLAFISDSRVIRRSTLIALSAFMIGISNHCVRWYTSYETIIAHIVVLGIFSGNYLSLYAAIIVDFMSIERLQSVLGFTALFQGCAVASSFYLVGYLRDATGSYVMSYHVLGAMVIVGGLIMLSLPYIHARSQKKDLKFNIHE
ncbi:monocarboxylate transporter 14-like [Mya arenaria]|uniref:monocarboxylate transporter 14-like n=1 Tax=Mya arenaria TaxID=6604 RepID=UPI0022E022D0|nr:monocarboxylate transporter 14-like [Mya arenaria]